MPDPKVVAPSPNNGIQPLNELLGGRRFVVLEETLQFP